MKYLIISIIFGLSIHAGEVDRIEAIVQDIENLREDYNSCMKELNVKNIIPKINVENSRKVNIKAKDETIKKYIKLLNKEKKKNKILSEKLKSSKIPKKDEKADKLVNNLKSLLIIKEKEIDNLENKIINLEKNIDEISKSKEIHRKNILCKDNNRFPNLIMKTKKEKKTVIAKEKVESKKHTKAFAFRLTTKSDIYDSIDGNIIKSWEEKTSFTSNIINKQWIRITGYFVNAKWVKAEEELWVKEINTIKR